MRLFYLHEQQQTRNQNVLAHLRTQQQLGLAPLIPHVAGLSVSHNLPSPRPPAGTSPGTPVAPASSRQAFSTAATAAGGGSAPDNRGTSATGEAVGSGGGRHADGGDVGEEFKEEFTQKEMNQGESTTAGDGRAGVSDQGDEAGTAAQGRMAEEGHAGADDLTGSGRSSFEKDQGPVVSVGTTYLSVGMSRMVCV